MVVPAVGVIVVVPHGSELAFPVVQVIMDTLGESVLHRGISTEWSSALPEVMSKAQEQQGAIDVFDEDLKILVGLTAIEGIDLLDGLEVPDVLRTEVLRKISLDFQAEHRLDDVVDFGISANLGGRLAIESRRLVFGIGNVLGYDLSVHETSPVKSESEIEL
jgi:hypothetical protein